MLRESSSREGTPANLRGIIDTDVELNVRHGSILRAIATALVGRDEPRIRDAIGHLEAVLGTEAVVTAIGVVANFQMMNRALDAVGIPRQIDQDLAGQLAVDPGDFGGAHGAE